MTNMNYTFLLNLISLQIPTTALHDATWFIQKTKQTEAWKSDQLNSRC